MSRFSRTLYLLGGLLFSWTLLFLTYFLYATTMKSWWEDDTLLAPWDPGVNFLIAFLFTLSASLILLAMLRNSLRPKTN